ncbi:MAG: hypothetical protein AAFN78_17365 [Pseudomonadota bacterium]
MSGLRGLGLLAVAATLSACAGGGVMEPLPGEPFLLAEREVQEFETAGFSVKFHGVIADSRCPSDTRCSWGGNAEIRLLVETLDGRRASTVTLHTAADEQHATERCVFDHTVRLLRLDPERVSSGSALLNDYAVTLTLTEGCATSASKGATGFNPG